MNVTLSWNPRGEVDVDLQLDGVPGHLCGEGSEALVAAIHCAAPAHALVRAARGQPGAQGRHDHQAPEEPCQPPHGGGAH